MYAALAVHQEIMSSKAVCGFTAHKLVLQPVGSGIA